jgi:Predicted transcriptional regulators
MTIGNRVLDILSKKHIKQKDLADFLDTKPSTVNGWKEPNRNPSSELIVRICDFLGVSYEYLLTGKESYIGSISPNDSEWLSLIHRLPEHKRNEFKSRIEGYLECYEEPTLDKTGTDSLGK